MGAVMDVRSLRFRILLLAAATIGLTLVVAGVSVKVLFGQHMQRRIAGELETRLADLAGSLAVAPDGRISFARPLVDARYQQPLSGAYWQVSEGSTKLLRSRSLWDETLDGPAGRNLSQPYELTANDGAELYALARPLKLGTEGNGRDVMLTVALDHRELAALSDAFGEDLDWALLAIALALFAGAFLQMHVGLAPLKVLRNAVQNARSGRASRLVGEFPSELQPLADDLNGLIDRHEALLEKARDRAAALAHGFKTPLTILGLEALSLDQHGASEVARTLREQIETMRRHVERELNRARIRGTAVADSAVGAGVGTNLAYETSRLIDLVQRMPRSDALAYSSDIDPGLFVRMDRHDFGEVLGNLLDNARKWARTEVKVDVLRVDGDAVRLSVSDDGPGFETMPPGSPDVRKGSGIGLVIVQDILDAYGTNLDIQRREGRTTVSLGFKARSSTPARTRHGRAQHEMAPGSLGVASRHPAE